MRLVVLLLFLTVSEWIYSFKVEWIFVILGILYTLRVSIRSRSGIYIGLIGGSLFNLVKYG